MNKNNDDIDKQIAIYIYICKGQNLVKTIRETIKEKVSLNVLLIAICCIDEDFSSSLVLNGQMQKRNSIVEKAKHPIYLS